MSLALENTRGDRFEGTWKDTQKVALGVVTQSAVPALRRLRLEGIMGHTASQSQERKGKKPTKDPTRRREKQKHGRDAGELWPSGPWVSPPVQGTVTLPYPAQRGHLGPAGASTQVNKQIVFSYQQLQSSHHIPGGNVVGKV